MTDKTQSDEYNLNELKNIVDKPQSNELSSNELDYLDKLKELKSIVDGLADDNFDDLNLSTFTTLKNKYILVSSIIMSLNEYSGKILDQLKKIHDLCVKKVELKTV